MLQPDRTEFVRFVNALFRHADHGDVLLRAFCGDEPWRPDLWRAGRPDLLVDRAEVLAEICAQAAKPVVFCSPVATFHHNGRGSEANLSLGLAVVAECDEWPGLARQYLEQVLGVPTLVVASGGTWDNPETGEVEDRLHIYWRLAEPTRTAEQHADLKEARRLVQVVAGSDGSAVPVVHPMRWPGSWHTKGTPRMARIVGGWPHIEVHLGRVLAKLRHSTGEHGKVDRAPGEPVPEDIQDVAVALLYLPNDDLPWHEWIKIGLATYAATGGSEEGCRLWMEWSSKASKDAPEVTRARWEHFHTSPPRRIGYGTLAYLVRLHGVDPDLSGRGVE